MRVAILADVHANLAALEAVLEAIERERPDRVLCLGDVVGYNAEPEACIRLVRERCDAVVVGNHDRAAAGDPAGMGTNSAARQALAWTGARLDDDTRRWLLALPNHRVDESGVVMAHGCYLNDAYYTGYATSTMLEANLRAVADRAGWPRLASCGHTHTPMCGWLDDEGVHEPDVSSPVRWPEEAAAVLVNPGAVGQPRDGDPRAAFALVDTDARRFRVERVAYDVERTAAANARAGLPASLSDRLKEGR